MKKFFAAFLAALLVLGTSPVFAEDSFNYTITVDGVTVPSEPGYNGSLYRYTSIADALGYETAFHAETGIVESKKGDITVTFAVSGYGGATVVQEDEFKDYLGYFYAQNIYDKLYISYYNAEALASVVDAGLVVDESASTVSIYSSAGKQALAEQTDARLTLFNEMMGLTRDKNYTSQGTGNMTMNLSSKLFGLSGIGEINFETVSAKSGNKAYSKVITSNSGLMNLLHLNIDDDEISKSETIEIYTDGQQVYLKSKTLTKALLQEEDYAFFYDYPEQTELLMDQWVTTDNFPPSYRLLLNNGITLGNFIVDYCFETATYYANPIDMIDMFVTLMSDENITVTENNGLKTYAYKIDKNTYLKCLEPMLPEMSEEERAEFDAVMDGFEMEMTATETVTADGIKSVSGGKISLSNVPNPWNEDVFSGEILFSAEETAAFLENVEYAFPDVSGAVNLTDFVKSVTDADIFEH